MQLDSHIQAIQEDLAGTAGLGDEATAQAAQRLSEALGSTLHLRLLDLLGKQPSRSAASSEQDGSRFDSRVASPSSSSSWKTQRMQFRRRPGRS